ncbi:MAG: DUF2027 domain-containing protein [Bacteroidales bacterium]|nr:DUF2027 domain-containing protein [Bacteroidales bacterium]
MMFRKGDKVKFLNDVGGGTVTRVEGNSIHVLNDDGFEVPVVASQLLKAEVPGEAATPFTVATPASENVPETSGAPPAEAEPLEYMDLSGDEESARMDAGVHVLLGWTANRKKNGDATYNAYLINDCSYRLMYVASALEEGVLRGIQAGTLENNSSIHVTELPDKELKNIAGLHFDILFFKKGRFVPQEPLSYRWNIDEFYLTDPANYHPNGYLEEKALIYHLTEKFLLAGIEAVHHSLDQQERQKKRTDLPAPLPVRQKEQEKPEEIDLHIEQLTDHAGQLSPVEILDMQMSRFKLALEGAIRNKQKNIVFIHGVGNGRLRLEIRRTLDRQYPRLRYQDASFKEYGYGATTVFCK